MNLFIIFCLQFLLIFIKCVENKEFCDKNFKEKLLTGVMSYELVSNRLLYFLVFRENDVWSLELI